MTTQFDRASRVMLLAVIVWTWAAGVTSAQATDPASATSSLASVKARVPVGDHIYVTDTEGVTTKGRLVEVTADKVQLDVGGDRRSVAAPDVRRIQWQRPDSPLTGVLIGAGIGAIPGLYWLAVDPNECRGMCAEEYALIAAGAAIGGLIDHLIKRKVTVYERRPPSTRTTSLTFHPHFTRGRIGGHLALTF